MRKRMKEMKNWVTDKDKERKLFTLEIQPNFPNNILRKIKQCLRTNQLIPLSRAFAGKLSGPNLTKKFPTFYRTRRFITLFTTARYMSLSSDTSMKTVSPPSHFLKIRFDITFCYLRLGLPSGCLGYCSILLNYLEIIMKFRVASRSEITFRK